MKIINCTQWRAGKCSLGLYRGRPSAGCCKRCQSRTERHHGPAIEYVPDATWDELHRFAAAGGDLAAFLPGFLDRVVWVGCSCQDDARTWVRDNPLIGDGFAWSVRFHNYVNAKLGKQILSVEEARPLYETPAAVHA